MIFDFWPGGQLVLGVVDVEVRTPRRNSISPVHLGERAVGAAAVLLARCLLLAIGYAARWKGTT